MKSGGAIYGYLRKLPPVIAAWGCAFSLAAPAQKPAATPATPPVSVRIPVAPLGYVAPSSFYLLARLSSVTLDFIDNDHLLFTFHLPGLMKRLPDSEPEDDDQTIRAMVLDLPSGNVSAKDEWRMHHRGTYLWRLGEGRFLVQQRNTLYTTDKSLVLTRYVRADAPIASIQLSPDRKMLVIETESRKDTEGLASTANNLGDPAPAQKPVQIYFARTDTLKMIARTETLNPALIPMMGDGFLQAVAGQQNRWLIQYHSFSSGQQRKLTEISSNCEPSLLPLSNEAIMMSTCPPTGKDHNITVIDETGKQLWQQRWESRYVWPTFQLTQDGSRFAYSSLQVSHPIGPMDPIDESGVTNQLVGVFDTQTGQLRMVKNATPILSAGQNYALSSDGTRFAILREGAIEVYDLPHAPAAP